MIQFLRQRAGLPSTSQSCASAWWHDLLQHPALAEMDERQLADLPMPRLAAPVGDRQSAFQAKGASSGVIAGTSI
jgi:hypothetical protein